MLKLQRADHTARVTTTANHAANAGEAIGAIEDAIATTTDLHVGTGEMIAQEEGGEATTMTITMIMMTITIVGEEVGIILEGDMMTTTAMTIITTAEEDVVKGAHLHQEDHRDVISLHHAHHPHQ